MRWQFPNPFSLVICAREGVLLCELIAGMHVVAVP